MKEKQKSSQAANEAAIRKAERKKLREWMAMEAELLRLQNRMMDEIGALTMVERNFIMKFVCAWCSSLQKAKEQLYSYEPNTRIDEANTENRFSAEDLLADIYLVLNAYFEAEIQLEKDGIHLYFMNGQRFVLAAQDVTEDLCEKQRSNAKTF